jgi:Leucine-rich repeat (LRR) protein
MIKENAMFFIRVARLTVLITFSLLHTISSAQSYKDDSLVVVEILKANGLTTLDVKDVSFVGNGRITTLSLDRKGLHVLPECIGDLDALEYLYCYDNYLYELPESFSKLTKLRYAYFIRNQFTQWPKIFYGMPKLELIDIGGNHLTKIPDSISLYTTVKSLYINDNYIQQLPESIIKLDLDVVHVAGNALCNASATIENWLALHDYYKENAQWRTYQNCNTFISDTSKIRAILDKNGWIDIPVDSVVTVENGNIVGIDLSYEHRATIQALSRKSSFGVQKMVLTAGIESMRYLRSLNISGNNIDTLPEWFGELCHLRSLNLSKNRLSTLPEFMASFGNLDTLNLAENQIGTASAAVIKWADIHAPGWKSTQSGSAVSSAFTNKENLQRMIVAVPSNGGSAIQIRFEKQIAAEITLYSISGRMTKLLAKKEFEPGVYNLHSDMSCLPKGIYIVTVRCGSKVVDASMFRSN